MSLVRRVSRLEEAAPDEPRFLRLHVEVHGEPPLTEAEQAVLEAEEARQRAEAKPGETAVTIWSRERATELGAPAPTAKEKGIRVIVELPEENPLSFRREEPSLRAEGGANG